MSKMLLRKIMICIITTAFLLTSINVRANELVGAKNDVAIKKDDATKSSEESTNQISNETPKTDHTATQNDNNELTKEKNETHNVIETNKEENKNQSENTETNKEEKKDQIDSTDTVKNDNEISNDVVEKTVNDPTIKSDVLEANKEDTTKDNDSTEVSKDKETIKPQSQPAGIMPRSAVTEYATDWTFKTTHDGYGITGLEIGFLSFYEREGRIKTQGKGQSLEDFTTTWYGGNMEFEWKLPAEAREGDYFILKVKDDSIYFNRAPMYEEHEAVPYENLDKEPNKYNNLQDNKFGVVTTVGTDVDAPNIPILNIYLVKKHELVFTVQRIKNRKGAMSGVGVIGSPVDKQGLVAVTGNSQRFVKNYSSQGAELHEEQNPDFIATKPFWEGVTPNRRMFTPQNGARQPIPSNDYLWQRKVGFQTFFYRKGQPDIPADSGNFEVPANVNFRTEMLGKWKNMELGREQLMPVYEDKNHVYFEYIYNSEKRQTKPWGLDPKRDDIIQPFVIPKDVYNTQEKSLQIEEAKFYEGDKYGSQHFAPRRYTPFPYIDKDSSGNYQPLATVTLNHVDSERLKSQAQTEVKWDIAGASRYPELYKIAYNKVMIRHGKHGSDRVIVADIKARKLRPIKDADGKQGYGLRLAPGRDYTLYQTAFHKITNTKAVAVSDKNAFLKKSLKLKKLNENSLPLREEIKRDQNSFSYIFKDFLGNSYTENESTDGVYDGSNGLHLKQKSKNGKFLFRDTANTLYERTKLGQTYLFHSNGVTYNTHPDYDGKNQVYVDLGTGNLFFPTRPIVYLDEVKIKIEKQGNKHIAYEHYNNQDQIIDQVHTVDNNNNNKDAFQIYGRVGYSIRVVYENGGYKFYKWHKENPDPVVNDGQWQELNARRDGDYYWVSGINYSMELLPEYNKQNGEVRFRVVDNEDERKFEDVSVDEFGFVIFNNLLQGHNYTLKEISTKNGYERLDKEYLIEVGKDTYKKSPDGQTVEKDQNGNYIVVKEGEIKVYPKNSKTEITDRDYPLRLLYKPENTYEVYNTFKSKIIIKKVDASGNAISSSKTEFELYKHSDVQLNTNGITKKYDGVKAINIVTEKSEGNRKVFGISDEQGVDPREQYWVLVEKTPPTGYEKLTKPIKLELKEVNGNYRWEVKDNNPDAEVDSDNITIKVKNIPKNIVKFRKVNLNGDILTGMQLKIKAKANTKAPQFKDEAEKTKFDGSINSNDKSLTWTSKSDDVQLVIENGTYTIEELQTTNGYAKLSAFDIKVQDKNITVINNHRAVSANEHATIEVPTLANGQNQRRDPSIVKIINYKGELKIHVHGSDLNNQDHNIEHAKFKLSKANGQEIATKTSNSLGLLTFEGIEPGDYKIEQVEVVAPYIRNTKQYNLKVLANYKIIITNKNNNDRQIVAKETTTASDNITKIINLEFINKIKNPELVVSKRITGIETNSNVAGRMRFRLSKDGSNQNSDTQIKTQNANQDFRFPNLKAGDYTLSETIVPHGYIRDKNTTYKVRVDNYGNVVLYSKPNSASNTSETLIEAASKDKLIKSDYLGNSPDKFAEDSSEDTIFDGNTITAVKYQKFNNENINNNDIPVGTYIGIDLGSIKHIKEFNFRQGRIHNTSDKLTHFKIEYSLDGVNYFDIKEISDGQTEIELTLDIFARYIRVRNLDKVINKWFAVRQLSVKVVQNVNALPSANNKYLFGNIEAPNISIEKLDKNNSQIITQNNKNKNYNAKFALYKVDDSLDNVDTLNFKTLRAVQEFSLANGKIENQKLNVSDYGRYVLRELESPDGFSPMKPVLLDLVLTNRNIVDKGVASSVAWRSVKKAILRDNSDDQNNLPIFTGSATIDDLELDYTKLANDNVITFKVKNQRKFAKLTISKRMMGLEESGIIPDKTVEFTLTQDGTNKVIAKIEKNTNEDIVFDQLGPGDYTLVESKVPEGFIRDKAKVYKVKVDQYANLTLYEASQTSELIEAPDKTLIKSEFLGKESKQLAPQSSPETVIFDGNTDNAVMYRWYLADNNDDIPVDTYIGADLGSVKHIKQFSFRQARHGNPQDKLTYFRVEYSIDGINYFDIEDITNGQTETEINLDIFARYIRVRNLEKVIKKWFAVREISVKVEKNDVAKNINDHGQHLVGNIEVPNLMIEKIDAVTKELIKGNNVTGQDYNAKFALYKVDDQLDNLDNINFETMGVTKVAQEFILKNGKLERDTPLNISDYGRYVLVEVESPYNYQRIKPILLDLVLTKRQRTEGEVVSVAFKTVKPAILKDNTDGKYTGSATLDDLIIDYSELESNNRITFKVKNQKISADLKLAKRIKGLETTDARIDGTVTFTLTNDKDSQAPPVIMTKKTNEDIVFSGLKEGDYTLVESKAPDGFVKEKDKVYKVRVDKYANVILYTQPKGSNETLVKEQLTVENNLIKSSNLGSSAEHFAKNSNETKIFDQDLDSAVMYQKTDGDNNNLTVGTYIGVDLKEVKHIKKFNFRQGQVNNTKDRFNHFKFQYSLDGINYLDLEEFNEPNDNNNDSNIVTLEKEYDIFARYIRVINLRHVTNKWFAVRQLAIETVKDDVIVNTKEQDQYLFGNIEVPSLMIEKLDKDTNEIIKGNNVENQEYNAKFGLYKVDDTLNNTDNLDLTDARTAKLAQEFILKQGVLEKVTPLTIQDYGRYALIEMESPSGYNKIKPILLDLVVTERERTEGTATSTKWVKVQAKNTVSVDVDTQETDDLVIDESKIRDENMITFKIANEPANKKITLKIKKLDKNNQDITGDILKPTVFEILGSDEKVIEEKQADSNHEFIFDNNTKKYVLGLYYIREKVAPSGYNLLPDKIPIFITKEGEVIAPAKLKANSNTEYEADTQGLKKFITVSDRQEEGVVTIKIKNFKSEFPETGGHGTLTYSVGGLLMMLVSYIGLKRKKREIQ